MKRINGKTRIRKAFVAVAISLSMILPTIGNFLSASAAITPHPKLDLSYLLGENVDSSTWTKEDRVAWDAATGDSVIKVSSIYPSTDFATKAALIDGQKQGGIDYTNGAQYMSAAAADLNASASITLNLQKMYKVNQIGITPAYYSAWYSGFPTDFTIEVSKDGAAWTTAVTKTGFANSYTLEQQDYLIPFDAEQECQYIRFNCTKILLAWNGTLNVVALQELEVYGVLSENQPVNHPKLDLTALLGENVNPATWTKDDRAAWDTATGDSVIKVSSIYPDSALATKASLIDGQKNAQLEYENGTQYLSNSVSIEAGYLGAVDVDESITLNLQGLHQVNQVAFTPAMYGYTALSGCPIDFTIAVSKDGKAWKTVITQTGMAVNLNQADYLFTFSEEICQYIRFSCTRTSGPWNGGIGAFALQELEVYGTALEAARFDKASVSLDGEIGVNFKLILNAAITDSTADTKMVFTQANGDTATVLLAEAARDGDYYVFSYKVAAKEMTDNINAKLIYADTCMAAYDYTVEAYGRYIIEENQDAKSVTMAKALLNYGAAAQVRFNYQTQKLANASFSGTITEPAAAAFDSYTVTKAGAVTGLTYKASTAVLESNTALRHYFILGDGADIADYTFKVGETTLTPAQRASDGAYYVEISDIAAKSLSENATLTVTKGGETYSITCSVYSYVKAILNGEYGAASQTAMKAVYHYCEAAKAFFAS